MVDFLRKSINNLMDHYIYPNIKRKLIFDKYRKIINHKKSSAGLGGSLCQVRASSHMVNNEFIYISNYSSCAGDHFPVFAVSPKTMGIKIEIRPSDTPCLSYLASHRGTSGVLPTASDMCTLIHEVLPTCAA